jgi:serine/threonine protein kinase
LTATFCPGCPPSLVGETLPNGLRVLEEVGSTRDGPVYLAEYPDGIEVALLVLRTEPAGPELFAVSGPVLQLHPRLRQAAEIRHPNVAVVHEVGEIPGGAAYVVLECLTGKLLSEVLAERGSLRQDDALNLFRQVAAGLEAAHQVGLVHANLSPDTILLTTTADGPLVKLIGFALSSSLPPNLQKPIDREVGLEYASPERLAGYVPDYRSDVYSLGAVLHQLLVGATPGSGSAGFASPAMRAAVVKAVMPIPEHRFPTVSKLVEAVQRAITAPRPEAPTRRKSMTTRRSLGRTAGTFLALAAGGFWMVSLQRLGPLEEPAQEASTSAALGVVPAEGIETGSAALDGRVEEPPDDSTSVRQKAPTPPQKTAAAAAPKVEKGKRTRAAAAERALNGARSKPKAPASPAPGKPPAASDGAPDTSGTSPEPASNNLAERAQVGVRIGLDEASRHLGVPPHAIEGMSPLFLGLAQGRLPDGVDPGAPLVRGVYLDPNGSLILLDQQRIQSQPMPAATATRWRMGDVMLYLHGDAQAAMLENLAKRVR